jgi:hypothetical protein
MALSTSGYVSGFANNAAAVSNGATQNTAAGAIIIVDVHAEWLHAVGAAGTVSSVTATGLVFQKRSGFTLSGTSGSDPYSRQERWWAYTAAGNTNPVYTVNFTLPSSTNFESSTMVAYSVNGFTGVNYITNPWDTSGTLPATASSETSSTPSASGISTTSSTGMLLAMASSAPTSGGIASTPPTGYTLIGNIRNTSGAVNNSEVISVYEVYSSIQTGDTVTWTGTISNWMETVDALTDQAVAAAGVPIQPRVIWVG